MIKHGCARKGARTPEYNIWAGIRARCTCPSDTNYARYGGRGIRMCSRWRQSFSAFLADVGSRPTAAHQIERRDNEGHYEPGNVRWATRKEQARNRRSTRLVQLDGETMSLAEATERAGVPYKTAARRLELGWSLEKALRPGRQARTHCLRGHLLNESNTYTYSNGERACQRCRRENQRVRRRIEGAP